MNITYFPFQAHCFAFGGFEVQMLAAFDAVQKLSSNQINLNKIDVWERNQDFDIAHFWGLGISNSDNLMWAKKAGTKTVLTALLGYYESPLSKIKNKLSKYTSKGRLLSEMLHQIDALVVISEEQKKIAEKYLKFDGSKIFVIPNMVNAKFIDKGIDSIKCKTPLENYILIVGSVCGRKNQINLAKAAIACERNLIIVGKPIPGEEGYSRELEKLLLHNENIVWIKGMIENSVELINLIKNCSIFALPSFSETQPISLLEAAVSRKPLIVSDKAFARQKYFQNAYLVNPSSIESIKSGIQVVMKSPLDFIPPIENLSECSELAIGSSYTKLYLNL